MEADDRRLELKTEVDFALDDFDPDEFTLTDAYLGLREPRQSIASLERALSLYELLELTDGQADVENALALALASLASDSPDNSSRLRILDAAVMRSGRSIVQLDGLLGKVSVPELRAHYAASRRGYYKTHIDLLMERYSSADKSSAHFIESLQTHIGTRVHEQ